MHNINNRITRILIRVTARVTPTVAAILLILTACDEEPILAPIDDGDQDINEEYYAGGVNGTTFNATSLAYKQAVPCIESGTQLFYDFMRGERIADKAFVSSEGQGYSGLGPTYIRKSCIACHPTYGGHAKRITGQFDSNDAQNGYLLMIYDPNSPTLALASKYFTGMTQTKAVTPFKAPINEAGIHIRWENHIDEYGNKFDDGETYELIYPIVTVDQSAILFKDFDMSIHKASIEGTIGIYGTGLLDAISDEDIRAQWELEQARGYRQGVIGNQSILQNTLYGGDITESDPSNPFPGPHPGRFTYLCTRATLDNGPGANAIWNITNVIRPERQYHYITEEYAKVMAQDQDVLASFGSADNVMEFLMSKTLETEMTKDDYDAFMVWHRSLAVPAARNLDDPIVQKGRELFYSNNCTDCHKPSWTTRNDYPPMQGLAKQKIFPYTDLLRHDLGMKEPGRVQVCRTTPLWGKGLLMVTSGHSDLLHDFRARNHKEAILWHGGEAKTAKEAFVKMSKTDREALIKFLQAI